MSDHLISVTVKVRADTHAILRRFAYSHNLSVSSVVDTMLASDLARPHNWNRLADWVRAEGGARRRKIDA